MVQFLLSEFLLLGLKRGGLNERVCTVRYLVNVGLGVKEPGAGGVQGHVAQPVHNDPVYQVDRLPCPLGSTQAHR
jgi:hypothetical protein